MLKRLLLVVLVSSVAVVTCSPASRTGTGGRYADAARPPSARSRLEGSSARHPGLQAGEERVRQLTAVDTSSDPFVFETNAALENVRYYPSVGNGHLATTIYSNAVFINGLYNGEMGYSHRAHVPAEHSSNLTTPDECGQANRTYRLNLRNAVYEELISLPGDVIVTYRTYAHQFYTRLLVTEVIMQRPATCESTCCDVTKDFVVARANLNTAPAEADFVSKEEVYTESTYCSSGNTTCKNRNGTATFPETPTTEKGKLFMYWNEIPSTLTLPANETHIKFTYVLSADMSSETAARAEFDLATGLFDTTELYDNHSRAFQEVWKQGDIEVEGDLHLQKVVRGCLYYLYTSLPSHSTFSTPNQFNGLSPGGLPNGANATDYQGHVFWDMETWMYPPILMLRPALARDMLSYRIHNIPEAAARAAAGGYEGARFPWESAQTGVEVTPDICVPCRENQLHITGDIAFAARQYLAATRDETWLTTPQTGTNFSGYDFILDMAKFWYTRPTFSMTKDRYEVLGVMPPDEHAEAVNNSVYTNVGASYAIHFARYAACIAKKDYMVEVPDRWLHVAQTLLFTFNAAKRYHEEFEGYDNQVVTNTTDVRGVKQADVVMLGYPWLWSMPDDVRHNDLVNYEKVTHPNGPAMTWGIYSTGWLDLGDFQKADQLFNKAYVSYAREPFKVWTEVQSGDGAINFITGMGGFLQTVMFGYGGMRLELEALEFRKPRMPPNTTRIVFRNVDYLDSQLDIEYRGVDGGYVTLNVTGSSRPVDDPLQLTLTSPVGTFELISGFSKTFSFQPFTIGPLKTSGCPAIPSPSIEVTYDLPTTTAAPTTPAVSGAFPAGPGRQSTSAMMKVLLTGVAVAVALVFC